LIKRQAVDLLCVEDVRHEHFRPLQAHANLTGSPLPSSTGLLFSSRLVCSSSNFQYWMDVLFRPCVPGRRLLWPG
jgi:hypothetical protein